MTKSYTRILCHESSLARAPPILFRLLTARQAPGKYRRSLPPHQRSPLRTSALCVPAIVRLPPAPRGRRTPRAGARALRRKACALFTVLLNVERLERAEPMLGNSNDIMAPRRIVITHCTRLREAVLCVVQASYVSRAAGSRDDGRGPGDRAWARGPGPAESGRR